MRTGGWCWLLGVATSFCVGLDLSCRRAHDVSDERPDQPPVTPEPSPRFGIRCDGAAFVAKQRGALAIGQYGEVRGDLAPPWLRESAEIGLGHGTPFDDRLPELADCAEGDLAVRPFSEYQPPR